LQYDASELPIENPFPQDEPESKRKFWPTAIRIAVVVILVAAALWLLTISYAAKARQVGIVVTMVATAC